VTFPTNFSVKLYFAMEFFFRQFVSLCGKLISIWKQFNVNINEELAVDSSFWGGKIQTSGWVGCFSSESVFFAFGSELQDKK